MRPNGSIVAPTGSLTRPFNQTLKEGPQPNTAVRLPFIPNTGPEELM